MPKKQRVEAREEDPSKRSASFDEVTHGYTEEEALKESSRCIQCKDSACIQGCPVSIDIKRFIYQITQKDYAGAYFTIREANDFPSICGRVCPAEYQCRKTCILTKKGSPYASENSINIHFLERFVGDYGKEHNLEVSLNKSKKLSGFKVAIVGSGPAGIACAGELARQGIKITLFEALHKPGGVLRYGIPPFRLPRDILDFELDSLSKLGAKIMPNFIIGKTKGLNELLNEGFDAVFLGLGAGIPSFLGIKGENLCNIYSANEFLTRVNLMSAYKFPEFHTPLNIGKRVIVIGGGNTAMDAARAALRIQRMRRITPDTTVLYRRTEIEMPARRLEIEHAKEEGIKFEFLVQPEEFGGNDKGFVEKLRCLKCKLGEPDDSGRRRPVAIPDSGHEVDCDMAVIAIGLLANQVLTRATPELKTDRYSDVVVDKETMETSVKNVYAGGDIVGGEGTVIEAMGMAKKASRAIIERLLHIENGKER
jgi:glutamate synthase (NADPH/NADH) small chain